MCVNSGIKVRKKIRTQAIGSRIFVESGSTAGHCIKGWGLSKTTAQNAGNP